MTYNGWYAFKPNQTTPDLLLEKEANRIANNNILTLTFSTLY